MRGKTPKEDLGPLNLEIEGTYRRNNSARRRRELQEGSVDQGDRRILSSESSSSFATNLEELVLSTFEETTMSEDKPLGVTLEDYSSSSTPQFFTSIARLDVQAANISYPNSLIQLIQGNLFHGLPNEDPYAHLATYIEICNTVKIVGVPEDAIRLNLFSFSLVNEAKRWLHSFKGNSLRTWEEVVENFVNKYFPESKTIEGKIKVSSFHQFPNESLNEALDRFGELFRKTPTHGFSEPIQLNIFIDGLDPHLNL